MGRSGARRTCRAIFGLLAAFASTEPTMAAALSGLAFSNSPDTADSSKIFLVGPMSVAPNRNCTAGAGRPSPTNGATGGPGPMSLST